MTLRDLVFSLLTQDFWSLVSTLDRRDKASTNEVILLQNTIKHSTLLQEQLRAFPADVDPLVAAE